MTPVEDSGHASSSTKIKHEKSGNLRHRFASVWQRLYWRKRHIEVVEVDSSHPCYTMLVAVRAGIHSILTDSSIPGPQCCLDAPNFELVTEKELKLDDQKNTLFSFISYASTVFSTIRRAVNIEESRFLHSVANLDKQYLEFISNSQSGQDFFLSYDMQYLIKTNKKSDIQFFLSVLGDYLQHFVSYPHSLLVKYLGCYSIKMPGKKRKFFLVMQNIFYPSSRIEDRFDVKGCLEGRYQKDTASPLNLRDNWQIFLFLFKPVDIINGFSLHLQYLPDPPGLNMMNVLKDQNFFEEKLQLGDQTKWFIEQLAIDAMFLRDLSVLDYSLLVGRQSLHQNELHVTMKGLVSRILKSVSPEKRHTDAQDNYSSSTSLDTNLFGAKDSSSKEAMTGVKPDHCHEEEQNSLPYPTVVESPAQTVMPSSGGVLFPTSLSHGIQRFNSEHRRLLPNTPNALHIIDGPVFRYYLGIVDFLTQWSCYQRVAYLLKSIKYRSQNHSTVPPDSYSRRFIAFLTERAV